MNVIYSSDENYVQHLAVSVLSLLQTNTSAAELNIFIISNNISSASRKKVEDIGTQYGRIVYWIDFAPFLEQLKLDMEWPISVSSYARLFIAQMLPQWCDRALYLDCDTVVCGDLRDLWQTDMKGCPVAGVKDLIMDGFKARVGLQTKDLYVNAGILLIDVACWRAEQLQQRFVDYINEHQGRVTHHDQGVINGTLRGNICVLHPRYNAMTPFFTNNYDRLVKFYGLNNYYGKAELEAAVSVPGIIHFTPEYVGRVWERGCKHPQAQVYCQYLNQTVWAGELPEPKPQSTKMKLLNWMCRNLPVSLLRLIIKNG